MCFQLAHYRDSPPRLLLPPRHLSCLPKARGPAARSACRRSCRTTSASSALCLSSCRTTSTSSPLCLKVRALSKACCKVCVPGGPGRVCQTNTHLLAAATPRSLSPGHLPALQTPQPDAHPDLEPCRPHGPRRPKLCRVCRGHAPHHVLQERQHHHPTPDPAARPVRRRRRPPPPVAAATAAATTTAARPSAARPFDASRPTHPQTVQRPPGPARPVAPVAQLHPARPPERQRHPARAHRWRPLGRLACRQGAFRRRLPHRRQDRQGGHHRYGVRSFRVFFSPSSFSFPSSFPSFPLGC